MDEAQLTALMRELYDEGGTHPAPPFPAAQLRPERKHRRRWLAVGGVALAVGVAVGVVTLTNTDDTARLTPVGGTSPSTTSSPSLTPSAGPTPTRSHSPKPTDTQPGVVYPSTGIYSQGPQISATRWMNANGWVKRLTATTYLSVYAGGETIDPSLRSVASYAAVLVISPADVAKFDQGKVALNALGTIYRPPGDPIGKLLVTSTNGNLVTLSLMGTSQTYTFDTFANTFR